MKKTDKILIVVSIFGCIIVLILSTTLYFRQQSSDPNAEEEVTASPTPKAEATPEIIENNIEPTEAEQAEKSGQYIAYNASLLKNAKTGNVVLFFKADWCPTCQKLDVNIRSELNEIPSDLTILILDYETEEELNRKYGVTYQHTLVQVDSDGNLIKKWYGSSDIDEIVSQLQ